MLSSHKLQENIWRNNWKTQCPLYITVRIEGGYVQYLILALSGHHKHDYFTSSHQVTLNMFAFTIHNFISYYFFVSNESPHIQNVACTTYSLMYHILNKWLISPAYFQTRNAIGLIITFNRWNTTHSQCISGILIWFIHERVGKKWQAPHQNLSNTNH